MPTILRTSIPPGEEVEHLCFDERNKPVMRKARSGELCRRCDTQLVFDRTVPDRTQKNKRRS